MIAQICIRRPTFLAIAVATTIVVSSWPARGQPPSGGAERQLGVEWHPRPAFSPRGEAIPTPAARRAPAGFLPTRSGVSTLPGVSTLSSVAPCVVPGVDCASGTCGNLGWQAMGPIDFQLYGHGEYLGRSRQEHVPQYRLRVDDELELVFRITRDETSRPYELNVGDEIRVESMIDANLDRSLIVQPDGTITLKLLGQVRATRHTVTQLRDEIEERYKKFYKVPAITVTPIKVNTKLEDLRATVDSRAGTGGQSRRARLTPEGTIALPAIGSIPAQGLTLEELKQEIDARYEEIVPGIEITPVLVARAPRYVYVLGEVKNPGRFTLEGPTTVMQALALAGSWNVGANISQVVVFRRADDWRLLATMLDLKQALLGHEPCPAGEVWLGDADLIVVPKSKILLLDNFIELVFTKGIYGVVPFSTSLSFTNLSALQ